MQRFVAFYLGTPENPMPFGGRDKEIAALNAWLTQPAASPAMLVAAPAGRGKSALLVRWVDQLDTRFKKVFVPISIRYETNRAPLFYEALAGRLANILGEKLPTAPSEPAQYYREKVIEYIDRLEQEKTPTLIVIDGLDEATGWRFDPGVFPRNPSATLKILVSARVLVGDHGPADWLRRLGWSSPRGFAQVIEPLPLGRAGIADVLNSMGCPLDTLAVDVDILGELHRLTEGGDPLLLELYVSDLWSRGSDAARLRPTDLAKLKPGFSDYFRNWFDDQERIWRASSARFIAETMEAVLLVLASAMGPLKFTELEQLLFVVLGKEQVFSKKKLEPLQRFIVGDGIETGYALAHPKLADFLRLDYFGDGASVRNAERAFTGWCQSVAGMVNAGKMSPLDVPSYPLLYYTQHLDAQPREDTIERYRELLEDGWRRAWLALDDGEQGFARDAAAALDAFQDYAADQPERLTEPGVGAGGQMRALLCLTSINSIGIGIPSELLIELHKLELITPKQVINLARHHEPFDQFNIYSEIADVLTEEVAAEVFGILRELGIQEKRTGFPEILLRVALRLPQSHQNSAFAAVEVTFSQYPDDYTAKLALQRFAKHLPEGFADRVAALRLEVEQSEEAARDTATQEGETSQEREFKEQLNEASWDYRSQLQKLDEAAPEDLEEIVQFLEENFHHHMVRFRTPEMFREIVRLTGHVLVPRLIQIVKSNGEGAYAKAESLLALLPLVPEDEQLNIMNFALQDFEGYWSDDFFDKALEIVPVELLRTKIGGLAERAGIEALADVAQKVPSALAGAEIDFLLENLEEVKVSTQVDLVQKIAPHLSDAQQAFALVKIRALDSDYSLSRALSQLVPYLTEANLETAAEIAQGMQQMQYRGRVLASLIPVYRERGLDMKVRDAQRLAFTIGQEDLSHMATLSLSWDSRDLDPRDLGRLLQAQQDSTIGQSRFFEIFVSTLVMSTLPEGEKQQALREASEAVGVMKDPVARMFGLALVASLIEGAEREPLVDQIADILESGPQQLGALDGLIFLPLLFQFSSATQRLRQSKMSEALVAAVSEDSFGRSAIDWARFGLQDVKGIPAKTLMTYLRSLSGQPSDDETLDADVILKSLALLMGPSLPSWQTAEALEILFKAGAAEDKPALRAMLIATIMPLMEGAMLEEAFREFVAHCRHISRPEMLHQIAVMNGAMLRYLAPIVDDEKIATGTTALPRLCGKAATEDIRAAIKDVSSWWP